MKNKNIIALCVLVGILIIVIVYSTSKQSQKNIAPEVVNTNNPTVETQPKVPVAISTTDLNLQTKCATQAQILLKSYRQEQNGVTINETNHFNKNLQKCFVNFSTLDNVVYVVGSEVRDAYENKVLVSCHSGGPINGTVCDSWSTGEYQRVTKEVGEQMIKDYMNN